ncbi:hypothetical protein V6N13_105679 [Hibiscus sabdariffa]|uniref:Uncharacterized protein n=1 Tax=Hibiscus sabdariffa TaxID=183260 RepID=A0ABR2EYD7_9ROSI
MDKFHTIRPRTMQLGPSQKGHPMVNISATWRPHPGALAEAYMNFHYAILIYKINSLGWLAVVKAMCNGLHFESADQGLGTSILKSWYGTS